ncbi:hypothetical protein ACFQZZ_24415 [Nocardia sp. GCM10030253]|uniref:hypothetical protein n=1 Tax=Nocardia sp. GCM10030253 TaxID=3273404 RepID=UPI003633449D
MTSSADIQTATLLLQRLAPCAVRSSISARQLSMSPMMPWMKTIGLGNALSGNGLQFKLLTEGIGSAVAVAETGLVSTRAEQASVTKDRCFIRDSPACRRMPRRP